jgi:hypothetical protein
MNEWIDASLAGLTLLWYILLAGLAFIGIAFAIESLRAASMRRRARHRAAYERYCARLDDGARRLAGGCWRGPQDPL